MKNESLTPNPSPKGEGSKMKNEEWGMENGKSALRAANVKNRKR